MVSTNRGLFCLRVLTFRIDRCLIGSSFFILLSRQSVLARTCTILFAFLFCPPYRARGMESLELCLSRKRNYSSFNILRHLALWRCRFIGLLCRTMHYSYSLEDTLQGRVNLVNFLSRFILEFLPPLFPFIRSPTILSRASLVSVGTYLGTEIVSCGRTVHYFFLEPSA